MGSFQQPVMMLSRTAEAVYWMARYVERAESYARILAVNMRMSLDLPEGMETQWKPLVQTTGDTPKFLERYSEYTQDNVTRFLVFDEENPNSIISCLRASRENARTVRDAISSEMWHQLNQMFLETKEKSERKKLSEEDYGEYLQSVKTGSHLFCGIMDSVFSHGEAWNFGVLGRFLERADKTTRIVDTQHFYLMPSISDAGTTVDLLQWTALLRSVSAFEMYRKTHGQAEPMKIARFLLLDAEFPRSVLSSVVSAAQALVLLDDETGCAGEARSLLADLAYDLRANGMNRIASGDLHGALDQYQTQLNNVGTAVAKAFFVDYDASGS